MNILMYCLDLEDWTGKIPDSITQNLNPAFEIREYQKEAFARFIQCLNEGFPGKRTPLHLLFNMATGSGKTFIMAGLISIFTRKDTVISSFSSILPI